MSDPTKKPGEPDLPDKTRREDEETDVERQQPPGREGHEREMQERRPHRDEPG